jgi:hypothetical protein
VINGVEGDPIKDFYFVIKMSQIVIKKISKVKGKLHNLDDGNLVFSCQWFVDLSVTSNAQCTSIDYTDGTWTAEISDILYWSTNGGTFTVKYSSDANKCNYWFGTDCFMWMEWDNQNQDNYDTVYDPVPSYYTQVITIPPNSYIDFIVGPTYGGGETQYNGLPVTGTIEIYQSS